MTYAEISWCKVAVNKATLKVNSQYKIIDHTQKQSTTTRFNREKKQ